MKFDMPFEYYVFWSGYKENHFYEYNSLVLDVQTIFKPKQEKNLTWVAPNSFQEFDSDRSVFRAAIC